MITSYDAHTNAFRNADTLKLRATPSSAARSILLRIRMLDNKTT